MACLPIVKKRMNGKFIWALLLLDWFWFSAFAFRFAQHFFRPHDQCHYSLLSQMSQHVLVHRSLVLLHSPYSYDRRGQSRAADRKGMLYCRCTADLCLSGPDSRGEETESKQQEQWRSIQSIWAQRYNSTKCCSCWQSRAMRPGSRKSLSKWMLLD